MGAAAGKEAGASKAEGVKDTDGSARKEALKKMDVTRRVDEIAARYITRSRFRELKHLDDPRYCNELVILTSKALGAQLDSLDIGALDKKQESGTRAVEFGSRRRLADQNQVRGVTGAKKRQACERIAEHYVKIAHVFAAIQSAVGGTTYSANTHSTERTGSPPCAARLKALAPTERDGRMLITPEGICNLNRDSAGGKPALLKDEFGRAFSSFSALYDDEYTPGGVDVASGRALPGQWKRSAEMDKLYKRDVTAFYKAFTGNDPPESDGQSVITSFDAIPLSDYRKSAPCARANEVEELEQKCSSIRSVSRLRADLKSKETALAAAKDEEGGLGSTVEKLERERRELESELDKRERSGVGDKEQDDAAYQRCVRSSKCKWILPSPNKPGQCVADRDTGAYRGLVEGPKSDRLFEQYGDHYRKMLDRSNKAKDSLNGVLDQLFTTYEQDGDAVPIITVSPGLTRAKLTEVIGKTRDILSSMYIDCEKDFRQGVKLLDEIIKDRGSNLQDRRLDSLDRAEAQAYAEPVQASPAPMMGDYHPPALGPYSADMMARQRDMLEAERLERLHQIDERERLRLGLGRTPPEAYGYDRYGSYHHGY